MSIEYIDPEPFLKLWNQPPIGGLRKSPSTLESVHGLPFKLYEDQVDFLASCIRTSKGRVFLLIGSEGYDEVAIHTNEDQSTTNDVLRREFGMPLHQFEPIKPVPQHEVPAILEKARKLRQEWAENHEILTKRCRLRYPHKDDIPHIWSATRVRGFNDGMLWDPPANMAELDEPLVRNQESWIRGEAFTWSIVDRENDDFIGRISIRTEKNNYVEWSIGFWVHPLVQGRGYATEAASAVIEFGFEVLRASIITAAHATWNEASGKILTKIGMTRVRLNPQGFKKQGEWVEEFEYEIRTH